MVVILMQKLIDYYIIILNYFDNLLIKVISLLS